MPLKITVSRTKFAIISVIVSTILCAIPFGILIGVNASKNSGWDNPYFIFSTFLLGVNVLLAVWYGFIARKNQTLYVASTIILFGAVFAIALAGYITAKQNQALLIQLAWALAFMNFFYFLGEAHNDNTIYARIWGVAIVLALGAFLVLFLESRDRYETIEHLTTKCLIIGSVALGISAILMILWFIFIFAWKKALSSLGKKNFYYDVETDDESELSARRSQLHMEKIPRLYEGDVWKINSEGIESISRCLERYGEQAQSAIEYMCDQAKSLVRTDQDVDDFNSKLKKWNKDLNNDIESIVEFTKQIANDYWLELDYGTKLEYNFTKCKLETSYYDKKNHFAINLIGFDRTITFSCSGGSCKAKFGFDNPDFEVVNVGHHSAEIDKQASDPRYHPPGTELVEDE